MEKLTRAEVRANRETAIAFLKGPERRKAKSVLDRGGENRCCIGHMCFALGLKRDLSGGLYAYGVEQEQENAPGELMRKLGLYSQVGGTKDGTHIMGTEETGLAWANDDTNKRPQDIGAYLETVIEGGRSTPWKPLSSYPESAA